MTLAMIARERSIIADDYITLLTPVGSIFENTPRIEVDPFIYLNISREPWYMAPKITVTDEGKLIKLPNLVRVYLTIVLPK